MARRGRGSAAASHGGGDGELTAGGVRHHGLVPSTLPDGDPAPADGRLPDEALRLVGDRGLGFYVHVPFCSVRCGYCDFNTYTAAELGGPEAAPGASRDTYAQAAV